MKVGAVAGPGRRGRHAARAPLAEINIIPLVDVTLVVLIIFMVTTSFEKAQNKPTPPSDPVFQLPIELPASAAAIDTPQPGRALVLGVDKNGRKYVGSDPVTTETLRQRVREAAQQKPAPPRVRIDADRDARFQDVVEVVELCQFEGLRNVGLHTANKE